MRDSQRGAHRQPVVEQRPLGFPRQVPDQRDQNDKADFEEDRQAHQEGRCQHGPDSAIAPELHQQPVRQSAAPAGVFEKASDHRAQPHHHGDESQRVAESKLDGFENFLRPHSGGQPQRHAGDEQGEERVQLHR